MQIALIRHLPTALNQAGLLQGRLDPAILSPDAAVLAQITANQQQLKAFMPFDHVLVSSLQRTAMTADCYGYSATRITEPLLDEYDFGEYEGSSRDDFLAACGSQWRDTPQHLNLGEPMSALQARIQQLVAKYRHCDSLLLFTHAAWSRALISLSQYKCLDEMNRGACHIDNNELRLVTLPND